MFVSAGYANIHRVRITFFYFLLQLHILSLYYTCYQSQHHIGVSSIIMVGSKGYIYVVLFIYFCPNATYK